MSGSATDAVSRAIALTRERLFPIVVDKWLRLGFIAFLAGLADGSYNLGFQTPTLPGGPGKTSPSFDFDSVFREAERIIRENLTAVIIGSSLGLLGLLLLSALITWLKSRADFIFVESVIHDRTAIGEPWERLREPASRVFKLRFGISLAMTAVSLLLAGGGVILAYPALRSGSFLAAAVYFLPLLGFLFLIGFPLAVFLAVLRDFLVPLMYLDGGGVRDAWRSFRERLMPGRIWDLGFFYVLKLVLGVGAAFVSLMAMCLTCCIAALPYLSSVVLLPIHVFFRAFSLYMLEALGRSVFPVLDPHAPWHVGASAFAAPPHDRGPNAQS